MDADDLIAKAKELLEHVSDEQIEQGAKMLKEHTNDQQDSVVDKLADFLESQNDK